MKQISLTWVAVVLVLVGLGFILPAVAKLRSIGYLSSTDLGLLVVGLLLLMAGPVMAFVGWRRRKA
jgi:hypothetical protein